MSDARPTVTVPVYQLVGPYEGSGEGGDFIYYEVRLHDDTLVAEVQATTKAVAARLAKVVLADVERHHRRARKATRKR